MDDCKKEPRFFALTDEILRRYPEKHNPIFRSCVDFFDLIFIDRPLDSNNPLALEHIFVNTRKMLDIDTTLIERFDKIVRHRTSEKLSQEILNHIHTIKRNRNPYIIVGLTGTGKTTLLKYYFNIKRKDEFSHIYLDLGFLQKTSSHTVASRIMERLSSEIADKFPQCFNDENTIKAILKKHRPKTVPISDLVPDIRNNEFYLPLTITFLYEVKNIQFIFSMDNSDHCDPEVIHAIDTFVHDFASRVPALVIFAVREYTFHGLQTKSIYQNLTPNLMVDPPSLERVIKRRLEKAIEAADLFTFEDADYIAYRPQRPVGTEKKYLISKDHVLEFIRRSVEYLCSMHGKHNILENLERFTNYNIRFALHCLYYFFHSAKLDVVPLFQNMLDPTKPVNRGFNFWDFIECNMAIHYPFYDYRVSPFVNIFNLRDARASGYYQNTLCMHRILALCHNLGSLNKDECIERLDRLGYEKSDVRKGMTRLFNAQLIDSPLFERPMVDEATRIGITSKGIFYFEYLTQRFSYIYYVAERTPMPANFLVKLEDKIDTPSGFGTYNHDFRVQSVKMFIDFIRCEEALEKEVMSGGSADTRNFVLYEGKTELSNYMSYAFDVEGKDINKWSRPVVFQYRDAVPKPHKHPDVPTFSRFPED